MRLFIKKSHLTIFPLFVLLVTSLFGCMNEDESKLINGNAFTVQDGVDIELTWITSGNESTTAQDADIELFMYRKDTREEVARSTKQSPNRRHFQFTNSSLGAQDGEFIVSIQPSSGTAATMYTLKAANYKTPQHNYFKLMGELQTAELQTQATKDVLKIVKSGKNYTVSSL